MSRSLFLNVYQDKQKRVWGVARVCLADGSCLVVESRVYREQHNTAHNAQYLSGEDDEEPARNKALDEAIDKLATIAQTPIIKRAIPLPARVALALVIQARNAQKLQKDGDEEAAGALEDMRDSRDPRAQRAVRALRLWR